MTSENQARPLPLWLKALGSAVVLGHFFFLGVYVLNQPSGPWPTTFGESTAEPPQFATTLSQPDYLRWLRMTHNYRFATNFVANPEVKFEIKLYDKAGRQTQVLHFPEEGGNPWERHRFHLLAMNLAPDMPIQPNFGERVGGKEANPDVEIWDVPDARGVQRLKTVPQNLIPRDGAMGPQPWAKIAAQSFIRYQCRLHGAVSGELIRRSRNAVEPSLILIPDLPPAEERERFREMVASFGKITP